MHTKLGEWNWGDGPIPPEAAAYLKRAVSDEEGGMQIMLPHGGWLDIVGNYHWSEDEFASRDIEIAGIIAVGDEYHFEAEMGCYPVPRTDAGWQRLATAEDKINAIPTVKITSLQVTEYRPAPKRPQHINRNNYVLNGWEAITSNLHGMEDDLADLINGWDLAQYNRKDRYGSVDELIALRQEIHNLRCKMQFNQL